MYLHVFSVFAFVYCICSALASFGCHRAPNYMECNNCSLSAKCIIVTVARKYVIIVKTLKIKLNTLHLQAKG